MATSVDDSIAWTERGPGYQQRPLVQAHGAVLSLLRLEPGHRFPSHHHPQAQLGIVLQGGGRTRVDGTVTRLEPGSSYFVPPNLTHSFETNFGGPTVTLDLVVPPRPGRVMTERALTRELWAGLGADPSFSTSTDGPLVPPWESAPPRGRAAASPKPRRRRGPRVED
jgi:quercetin dioxygenase-like cupin family protein